MNTEQVDLIAIEDEESIRWVIKQVLSIINLKHLIADSAEQGIKLVFNHRPKLVLVDVKLGSEDGLEIARKIGEKCPQTGIILCTGLGETIKESVKDLPILDIVEKPFEIERLMEVIKKAL
jgi:two-component system response regulator AtoC